MLALAVHTARAASCTLVRSPDIPVTMNGLRPLVRARINGRDALFVADSGAFFSMITPAAVERYRLTAEPSIEGLSVAGVGGGLERAQVARAKSFTILGTQFPNVEFIAAGGDFGNAVGLLGQNFFRLADVEYDLAHGVIRLVQPQHCGRDTPLAYWTAATHAPYSVVDIEFATAAEPFTKSIAYLNGTRIRVIFDTGSPSSLLTLKAAKRAGITPASEGVTRAGPVSGIGRGAARTWIAPFQSFKIGDEQIENTRLRFGDIELRWADMLLGVDFFLSHRIYVASSQSKVYFTYNGGPVFDLTPRPPAQSGR
jgi:hypothetical protein